MKFTTTLERFAEYEAPELSSMLTTIATTFRERERLRDSMTSRMTTMTQEPLRVYESVCLKVKSELKKREGVKEIYNKKQNSLDKVIVAESGNRAKINESQLDLQAAAQDVEHTTNQLVDSVNRFEVNKRRDLKACMSDMVCVSLSNKKGLERNTISCKVTRGSLGLARGYQ
jgi:hypothetical protein